MIVQLLAAAAIAAAPATQFDLECVGTVEKTADGPKAPYSVHYRIDLDAMRWCADSCEQPMEIQRVSPDRITFIADETEQPDGGARWHHIDRVTGELSDFTYSPGGFFNFFWHVKAACSPAPFSGMPTARF